MKKDFLLSKREGLAVAMEQLLHYNVWSAVSLDKSAFEEELLAKYFDSDFNDPINEEVESVIAIAVAKTVYEKDYIPNDSKKELAQKASRQHVESLRSAKLTYHEEVKGMPRREAQKRREENKMVARMARVDNTYKWGVRRAAKAGVSYGIGSLVTALFPQVAVPVWLLSFASYGLISILPGKIKMPIRKGVTKIVDTVVETTKNVAGDLAKGAVKVGKTVLSTLGKVGKAISESKIGKGIRRLFGMNRKKQ